MYLRKIYGDLGLNINGYLQSGIQSFNASYDLPNENILAYGYGVARATNEAMVGQVSFTKLIVGEDNLFSLISGIVSGHLNYTDGHIGFNKGFIDSYNVAATVNDKPSLTVNLTTYGNFGSGIIVNSLTSPATWNYQAINRGDIDLTINNQDNTNRVVEFNYTINIGRNPRYLLGEKSPSYVLITWPIEIETTFTLELDNYQFQEISGALCSPQERNLVIKLHSCGSTGIVTTYKAPRAKLLSESIDASIGPNTRVNLTYRSYVNGFSELL